MLRVLLGILLLSGWAAAQAHPNLADHVRFKAQEKEFSGTSGREVDVDADIAVTWVGQAELFEALAVLAQPEVSARSSETETQVAMLKAVAEKLVAGQKKLEAMAQQRLAGKDAEANALEGEAATELRAALSELLPLAQSAPSEYKRLSATILAPIQVRYRAVAEVLSARLSHIADALERSQVPLEVSMEAYVEEPGGVQTPVRVQGYFEPKNAGRKLFQRFQTAIDARTRNDLAVAGKAAEVANQLLDPAQRKKLQEEIRAVREEVRAFLKEVNTSLVEVRLDALLSEIQGMLTTDPALQQLIDKARALSVLIARIGDLPLNGELSTIDDLVKLYDEFGTRLTALAAALPELKGTAESLLTELRGALTRHASLAYQDLVTLLDSLVSTAQAKAPELTKLASRIGGLVDMLGLRASVAPGVADVQRVARALTATSDLGTTIVPQTAAERRPGDTLRLKVVVRRAGSSEDALASEEWIFRLRIYGFYTQFRGGLIFADPRSGGFSGQDYEATAAIAYHLRYGFHSCSFLNEIIAPGIGVSMAVLDFEDESDLEIGLAGNLTFFNDLLWVGYGRNLQAESDYFYVGINPLTLADLVRGTGPYAER